MRLPPLLIPAVLSALPVCFGQTPAPVERPNVILILADDMAIGDIAAFNGGVTQTPNLDRLMAQGLYFNQAYSGSAVSAPSRAALLTGRYPHRTGCVTLNSGSFPELVRIKKGIPTVGDIFKANGYTTAVIGKWHTGSGEGYLPRDRGFDVFEGFASGSIKSYFKYDLDINGKTEAFDGLYLTENLSARAIDFVQRNKDKPFFLHLAHYAPHRPLNAPKALVQKYLDKGLPKKTATIYAMVEVLDKGVGELMETLDKLGLRERTVVIFSSDNGPDPVPGERFNVQLRGTKYEVFEGGIHVPFIVSYPPKVAPGVSDVPIHFTDVLPTLVQLCALKTPANFDPDGGSMLPLLEGAKTANLPSVRVWQWNRGVPDYTHNAAIREGKWKLVRPPISPNVPDAPSTMSALLFNLETDPFEQEDLAQENPKIVRTLGVKLEQKTRELEFDRLSREGGAPR